MIFGGDEFGLSKSERIAMADAELAEARKMAGLHPAGFPTQGMRDDYRGRLNSSSALYHSEGLRLLARRVSSLARESDARLGWARVNRLNNMAR